MDEAILQVQRALITLRGFLVEVAQDAVTAYKAMSSGKRTLVTIGLLTLLLGISYWALRPSAVDVRLTVRYPFRSADMTVVIDGESTYSTHLTGQSKKKLLVLDRVEGNFGKTFSLQPGRHTVEVSIRSEAYAYDQSTRRTFDAAAGRGGTLVVTALNGADMQMNWLPVPGAGEGGHMPAFLGIVNSILLTALGTVFSAIVGFFVQEHLKSHRAPAAAAQPQPAAPANSPAVIQS